MGDDVINRAKEKDYLAIEAAKYCCELQRLTYETYILLFEKIMRVLSRND